MPRIAPGEVELSAFFRIHLGPRFEAAGLRIEFHYNQIPGIHFKVAPPEEYREAITKGILDGLALRFPDFPTSASIWVLDFTAHEVDSSRRAFYRAGRMVIDQAFYLTESAT
jgi:hypothetical protein